MNFNFNKTYSDGITVYYLNDGDLHPEMSISSQCINNGHDHCRKIVNFLTEFKFFLLGFCTIENSRKHVNFGAYCYFLGIQDSLEKSYLENKSKNV